MSTPRPEPGVPGFSTPLKAKLLGIFVLCVVVAALVPRGWDRSGDTPPASLFLVVSVLVTAVCVTGLYWGIRSDLSLPRSVAMYAVGFNSLVIAVKFALAPYGLYEVNQTRDLTGFLNVGDDWIATGLVASLVFCLYATALWVIYRVLRQRLSPGRARTRSDRALGARVLVVAALAGALLLTGSWVLVLLVISGGVEYLSFVLTSAVSLLVGLALAGAVALAGLGFRAAGERAAVLGDAALLVSFFWLALFFLALYHVVWVVYVLVLVAIWPLWVVVPK